jgi:hypothetical protein
MHTTFGQISFKDGYMVFHGHKFTYDEVYALWRLVENAFNSFDTLESKSLTYGKFTFSIRKEQITNTISLVFGDQQASIDSFTELAFNKIELNAFVFILSRICANPMLFLDASPNMSNMLLETPKPDNIPQQPSPPIVDNQPPTIPQSLSKEAIDLIASFVFLKEDLSDNDIKLIQKELNELGIDVSETILKQTLQTLPEYIETIKDTMNLEAYIIDDLPVTKELVEKAKSAKDRYDADKYKAVLAFINRLKTTNDMLINVLKEF